VDSLVVVNPTPRLARSSVVLLGSLVQRHFDAQLG
jgi:hypothetical protein